MTHPMYTYLYKRQNFRNVRRSETNSVVKGSGHGNCDVSSLIDQGVKIISLYLNIE